jgi:cobalt/nickel transport protein
MANVKRKILIGLLALVLLSPLGLLLPEWFHAGKPWGEWSTETVAREKGYTPKGMQKDAALYKAPITDYNLGKESDSILKRSGSYILSGIIGVGTIVLITFGISKFYRKQ